MNRGMVNAVFSLQNIKSIFWIFDECTNILIKKWEDKEDLFMLLMILKG
jgi:hypothetical protein